MSEMVLRIERSAGGIAAVVLNRPHVRNAFNAALIGELHAAFLNLSTDQSVRAITLRGAGRVFCGGADVNWMRDALALSAVDNVRDAERMSEMFRAIDTCTKPVIGCLTGAALGGGAGLAAVCDIVVCSPDTVFGFTETKLGIIPAVISPFVLAKIGVSAARALFLSGERFDAGRAQRIGLVHEIVSLDAIDARVTAIQSEFATAGPAAVAAAKVLIARVRETDYAQTKALTAQAIAAQRTSAEGQEGLRAFVERRPAAWVVK